MLSSPIQRMYVTMDFVFHESTTSFEDEPKLWVEKQSHSNPKIRPQSTHDCRTVEVQHRIHRVTETHTYNIHQRLSRNKYTIKGNNPYFHVHCSHQLHHLKPSFLTATYYPTKQPCAMRMLNYEKQNSDILRSSYE